MNRDLFLAILSMDSYQRGYDVQLRGLSESGNIGNAINSGNSGDTTIPGTPLQFRHQFRGHQFRGHYTN